jgi:flagellar protein FlaI
VQDAENKDINVLDTYEIDVHGSQTNIRIYTSKNEFIPIYDVTYEGISLATKLLLFSLRPQIISLVPLDISRIRESEYMEEVKNRYIEAVNILIDKYLPNTGEKLKKVITSFVINMMIGMGDLEVLLADENLEEIAVNGAKDNIWIFHKKYQWCKTNIKLQNEEDIYDKAEQIGRIVGREINNLSPIMDAELLDGSRVNATLFPISQGGNTITIRKFSKNPWTMPALIKNHTLNPEMAGLIWECIENEISLLVSGGTASGKTSLLNAMSIFFPPNRRIISIEETRELTFPNFYQWLPMLSRPPNPEGKGEVTIYNLMINAMRQRPDIIVVGEIRVGKDAETLFEAIHTGHAVYGSVHADNSQDTITRMTNPPISIPKILMNALGGVVVQFRHRMKGIRRTLEISEVLRSGDVNVYTRWNMRNDTFAQIGDLTRLSETLSLYSGLTKTEIEEDIKTKAKVLLWMSDNNIMSIDDSGLVISNYYKNKEKVIDIVNNNIKYSIDIF